MITKQAAGYVDASPHKQRCDTCTMFRGLRTGGRCSLVVGLIKAGGWCEHWAAKIRQHAAEHARPVQHD